MKNPRVIRTFGLGFVLALAIGLCSSVYAGPGADWWRQQDINRAKNVEKAKAAAAAKSADAPTMSCPHCKTKVLEENSFTNVSGKTIPHRTVIGKSHSCDGCSGVVTVTRGKVTDEMKRTCPICAKAAPACCSVKT